MYPFPSLNSLNRYEIKIHNLLDASWLGLFEKVEINTEILDDNTQVTTISNVILDQAGLVGLIRRLHGLGLVLISIQQVLDE
jgi:hypothetical protein